MKSTSISVEGDKSFVLAFGSFAKVKGSTAAKLVREALNEKYGVELAPFLDFFAASAVTQNTQSNHESNNPAQPIVRDSTNSHTSSADHK